MNITDLDWHLYEQRDHLAERLASDVAERLQNAIESRGGATLAVSGGSTPALFFEQLSYAAIDWQKITVTLVDERFVPESHERSNAKLVKEKLLKNAAAEVRFVPLYHDTARVEEAAARSSGEVGKFDWPLDVVVLGMGLDGHTASFFPDATTLEMLLDPSTSERVLPVQAQSAGEPRLTLSLPAIVSASFLALHIEGENKRDVLEETLGELGPEFSRTPTRRVLDAATTTPHIYWAP
ncbi:6-phosphogluconolactonase [Limoniibacter endophyticus]|uniref:6-phosphogluconolactonase n=1 Tax=Limoniibacter endophyticus TaxID=1565040 RepID=A0A8J3GFL5_9HYPH|nr:6-phosphogluconolactonase [Limoniibacter endophyticus]GHC67649.1 6-phosphogluconolactonase [Limoniibacter endophyticus]